MSRDSSMHWAYAPTRQPNSNGPSKPWDSYDRDYDPRRLPQPIGPLLVPIPPLRQSHGPPMTGWAPPPRQSSNAANTTARNQTEVPSNTNKPTEPKRTGVADFVCKPKYGNTLPDVPFDGKFLPCPMLSLKRFIDYKKTSLERTFKWDVNCEHDVGVYVNLVDRDMYLPDERIKYTIDPKDAVLLEDDEFKPLKCTNAKRSQSHAKVVPWMRKTVYLEKNIKKLGTTSDRRETKIGYNMNKQKLTEELNMYRDRERQLEAIEKTFEDVKKPVKNHYSKKGVHAVEEMYLMPDFELWKYSFAEITFDADPAMVGAPESMKKPMMENTIIKGMLEEDEEFVVCFAPSMETLQKLAEDKELTEIKPDRVYHYLHNRAYTWDLKNKNSKSYSPDYFIYSKNGCLHYNEFDTKVKLTRRKKAIAGKKSVMHVTHVDLTQQEIDGMAKRMKDLLCIEEEDEDTAQRGAHEDPNKDGALNEKLIVKAEPNSPKNSSDDTSEDEAKKNDKSSSSYSSTSDDE